jgi:hypothetical protein
MMQIFVNRQAPWFSLLLLIGSGIPLACSGARLDENTKAFTFDTPQALEGSNAPAASALAGAGGTTHARQSVPASRTTKATPTSVGAPETQVCSRLPDPQATLTTDWVRLSVRYEQGKLTLLSARSEQTPTPESTARRMGRFAAELWIGCELIDRVRFDFPLLAGQPVERNAAALHQPDFERQGRFETTLLLPNSDRATRLELLDRAYEGNADSRVVVPWPLPSAPPTSPATSVTPTSPATSVTPTSQP